MPSTTPLRRELLLAFGILFAGALFLAAAGLLVLLPVVESPGEALAFVVVLFAADLAVVFFFTGYFLRRRFVLPVEGLVSDVGRIAEGEYEHRVRAMPGPELASVQESVNAMADRLVRDRRLLADNVESLERTNQDLVEARDQVIQAARLASVGTLAAGIAHEVGNPLGAILVYVDLARSRARRAGADTDLLDSVRKEAERIDGIVRGLLDYAQSRDEDPQPSAVAPVLERVRDLLESQGHLGAVEHEWRVDARSTPRVLMDPHRLEQVMVNLLLNALHALRDREDGCIRITVSGERGRVSTLPARRQGDPPDVNYRHRRRVARDLDPGGPDSLYTADRIAVIRVEDNGPGIAEADLEQIFDPFFTTKEPGEGTGLGLAICARLVEGMGGRIRADRGEEGGAVFTIRLPAVSAEAERRLQASRTRDTVARETRRSLGGSP